MTATDTDTMEIEIGGRVFDALRMVVARSLGCWAVFCCGVPITFIAAEELARAFVAVAQFVAAAHLTLDGRAETTVETLERYAAQSVKAGRICFADLPPPR